MKDAAEEAPIDPLRRVWIPIEKRDVQGRLTFRTTDGERYRREDDGSMRHATGKVNGKRARKARARERRMKSKP